ncbi:YscO family type III secretion system apparatus protein [Sinorhizobium sp. BJ1]|uniref:YscO family type III secretion system apparatus protein n=1 Tax=Sinorhizobium sp. BJ1 TaxID=2035455 RepID=UPI000BE9A3E7|nr:YscO family type III secretion system apparatus protein [Sinorhizobium sp. BJ1]PDT81129.1 type III secretion protein [Sinorhizobium sp. BJ1]
MTRKGDLRQLVELRAMRMRRAEEQAQRQHNRHDQTVRALEAAKAENLAHDEQRRREEQALYSNLAQGTLDHGDLERYRGALSDLDHRARELEEHIHDADRHERQEGRKREELAAEYRRKQELHDRIQILCEQKQRKATKRADLINEIEDEEAIRPKGRKR